jgi:phospholipid-translocating ATPase
VTEKEYRKWKEMYEEASLSLDNRAGKMRKIVEALERDMEFLGITGVEDKLQEDVRVSIESLRNAGIKIWMLTGDKIETACCIAISTSLKDPTETFFIMSDIKEKQIMEREINSFGNDLNNKKNRVLVIDGTSLATAIEYGEKLFFSLATRVKTVIACRCSPT